MKMSSKYNLKSSSSIWSPKYYNYLQEVMGLVALSKPNPRMR